ncbi:MAG: hypothetical protein ABSE51_15040 [Terracidiphilus sp.]|jgi:hypothetical protein
MTFYFRAVRLFVAAAGLCFGLSVSPFAHSQAARAAALPQIQEDQEAISNTVATEEANSLGEEHFVYEQFGAGKPLMKVCRLCTIDQFALQIGNEDSTTQAKMKEDPEIIYTRYDYSKLFGISEDEEQAMHTIILDTYYRLQENQKQYLAAHLAVLSSPRNDPERDAKLAKRAELEQEKHKILEDARAKLMQVLGDEDFKKLDEYEFKWERNAVVAPPAGATDQKQPGDNNGTENAPAVQ